MSLPARLTSCLYPATLFASLQAAEELKDEQLLKYYTDEWSRYTQGATFVNRLFAYLNRRECRAHLLAPVPGLRYRASPRALY